ncbi:MAG TPA: hypothetical protein VMR29_00150 [Candidatus Binatia bacterium]|nr:hypothetical protein [Candidatus Binatia bacterium]
MNRRFWLTALATIACGAGSVLHAEVAASPPEACRADAESKCGNESAAARLGCLTQHRDELSAQCRTAIYGGNLAPSAPARRHDVLALARSCRDDFKSLCSQLSSDAHRQQIVECLGAHQSELSAECASAVAQEHEGSPERQTPEKPRQGRRHGRGGGWGTGAPQQGTPD